MRTIILTIGLPGCGKTTYALDLMKKERDRWKRINRDDLRMMNDGRRFVKGAHDRENFITRESYALVRETLRSEYDVIVDNTHLSGKARKEIHDIAKSWGDVTVIEKVFEVPLSIILKQNAQREGDACVPEDVIKDMAKRYHVDKKGCFAKIANRSIYYRSVRANESDAADQDSDLPGAIICDLDGTLALMNGRNPYDAEHCDDDLLNEPVATTLKACAKQGMKIIFMSGRHDKFREPTLRFFENNIPELEYEGLFMRAPGDMRKDTVIKRELFDEHVRGKYYVNFVIDDRPSVVRMWRYELGLTVFQLDDREF